MADQRIILKTTVIESNRPDSDGVVYTKEDLEEFCKQLNDPNSAIANVKSAEIVEHEGFFAVEATIEFDVKFEI